MVNGAGLRLAVLLLLAAAARPASAEATQRVLSLLRRMTLEEKLSLVHGARDPAELGGAGYWPGVPRLGIPPLRFADGPPGINVNRDASGLPAPVALAATFDVDAARLFGVVLGRNAAALRQDVVLAPHVNLVRDPLFRRNHTALSEDPLLTAQLSAAVISGIQSQGVMAQVKHFAGYNGASDVTIDERTLRELYLPPFEAAIRAGVASVMCAYNRINGEWACENGALLNGVLRGELGFRGFVTSDWGAVHTPEAITRGLDLEMPGREIGGRRGGPYFTEPLRKAVADGSIPVPAVDRAVTRILTQMERFGMLRTRPARVIPARVIDVEADAAILRRIAEQGAVLLRNQKGALPLNAADLEALTVVGPTGGQLAAGYLGERAWGFEKRLVPALSALRALAPGASIRYAPAVDLTGTPIPPAALSHDGGPGLLRRREGVDDPQTRVDAGVDFDGEHALEPSADYSWTGMLAVPEDGDYTFLVQPALEEGSEGGGSISIDGRVVARTGGPGFGGTGMLAKKWSSILPTTDGRDNGRGSLHLQAGNHRISMTANSTGEGRLRIRFAWITPEARRSGIHAAALACRGRVAVVFAWSASGAVILPEEQDELIERVASEARKVIVVLNSGGPVLMRWKERAAAILEMWYPGQEGGWATAALLLGHANPSGRLPVTFPVRLEDTAIYSSGHSERNAPQAAPGTMGQRAGAPLVAYSEGVSAGYRWFDQEGSEPLFPFGHGLSYTPFVYSGLSARRVGDTLEVSFTVRNNGATKGAEVAQVYVGSPAGPPVPMPPKALAAVERLELEPGESRSVKLRVDRRALCYWSAQRHEWVETPGERVIFAGGSSRDLPLTASVR